MIRLLTLTFFLFVAIFNVRGQNSLTALKLKLLSADSVLIISHETTTGIVVVDEKTGKEVPLPKLVVNGKLNSAIIYERRRVVDTTLQQLATIISRPFQDTEIEIGKCFMPHHAIVFYSKGRLSFVDMCFGCKGIEISKDLKIRIEDFDDRKWNELITFYKQQGIRYKLYAESEPDED